MTAPIGLSEVQQTDVQSLFWSVGLLPGHLQPDTWFAPVVGMVGSLSDDSTETFWESSQDDRQGSISFSLPPDAALPLRAVWLFIDNQRDDQKRVRSVTLACCEPKPQALGFGI